MKFTAADLASIDPLEYVRAHPECFVPNGIPNPAVIANQIAGDALVLGATDVRVFSFGDWWIVSADADWLSIPCKCPASPLDAFSRVLGFPECQANEMRHEILANAYAECVVSVSTTDRFVVSGEVADDHQIWLERIKGGSARSVAFRMSG